MLKLPSQLDFQTLQAIPNLKIVIPSIKQQTQQNNPTTNQQSVSKDKQSISACYPPEFLKTLLIIKLNSLSKIQASFSELEKIHFRQLSNLLQETNLNIQICQSQTSLMKQILSSIKASQFSSKIMWSNFHQGNCLPTTILLFATNQALRLLHINQLSCALSFEVFDGRSNAFIPIVHQQKNHTGQLLFSNRINNLILFDKKKSQLGQLRSKQHSRVQDAYSTRCSPQVAGVSYQIVTECIQFLDHEANEFQLGYIPVGQQFFISSHSDERCVQLFDCLSISLHEISSISYVRSERMLNKLINRLPANINQKIQSHQFLFSVLEVISSRFLQNKNLCSPISSDTVPRKNYINDVQNSSYMMYNKYVTMWRNMKLILVTEILISTIAIKELKEHYKQNLTPILETEYQNASVRFQGFAKKGITSIIQELENYANEIPEKKINQILKYLPYLRPHQHHQYQQ